jgi:hypothetical protein
MNMGIPWGAEQNVWFRQKKRCASCGCAIALSGRTIDWYFHQINPDGSKDADNTVILCTVPPNNCHLRIGHGEDGKSKPCRIRMENLPHFHG